MSGYFDMHCHLLYGVDDGPKSMDESLELLRLEYRDGVRTIFLTPHYRRGMFECPADRIWQHFQLLQERAGQLFPDLRLLLGREVHVTMDIVQQLRSSPDLTLGGSAYVLLEFPEYADRRYLIDRCHDVIRGGYSPILAHAERCTAIRRDPELLQRLVSMGVQIQMNAGSLIGEEGLALKWFCRKAMKRGLLHYIGSDAHNRSSRRPNIGACAAYLEKTMGPRHCSSILIRNPRKLTERSAWETYE